VVNGHQRRYHKRELVHKVESVHFEVLRSGYWNSFLFIPIWMFRQYQRLFRRQPKSREGDLKQLPFANNVFYNILKLEEKLFDSINLPFGVSVYCIANKKLN
jgi:hypothetical protein